MEGGIYTSCTPPFPLLSLQETHIQGEAWVPVWNGQLRYRSSPVLFSSHLELIYSLKTSSFSFFLLFFPSSFLFFSLYFLLDDLSLHDSAPNVLHQKIGCNFCFIIAFFLSKPQWVAGPFLFSGRFHHSNHIPTENWKSRHRAWELAWLKVSKKVDLD